MKKMKRIIDSDPNTTLEGDKLVGIFRELGGDPKGIKAFLLVRVPWSVPPGFLVC